MSTHGVTRMRLCHSFAFCIVVVGDPGFSTEDSRKCVLLDSVMYFLDPLKIYCLVPEFVSIGKHLFIRRGKNKGK